MGLWKAFSAGGLTALLSGIIQVKQAAEANTSAVSGLGEDLAQFSELTAGAIAGKQDKPAAVACTIPTTGWAKDGAEIYPCYYDLPAEGVTASDCANVVIRSENYNTAVACGLCQTNETRAGCIRFRSVKAPGAAINAEYWLEQGKEQ